VEHILTDRFTVRFADGVDDARAREFLLREFKAVDVERDKRRPAKYRFRIESNTPLQNLQSINAWYVMDPNTKVWRGRHPVKSAYPNFRRIYPLRNAPRKIRPASDGQAQVEPSDVFGVTDCSVSGAGGSQPNDTYFPNQWALQNTGTNATPAVGIAGADVRAVDAWGFTIGSESIRIAVIDIGMDIHHEDLAEKTLPGETAPPGGNPDAEYGDSSHGTAVAGVAAAITGNVDGIAGVDHNARLIPVRVGYSSSEGWSTSFEAQAIDTAAALGANVIINSWNDYAGGSDSEDLNEAIRDALREDRVVVFSAGNHKRVDCLLGNSSCIKAVRYPGTLAASDTTADKIYENALIVVSATNQQDQFQTIAGETVIAPSNNTGIDKWGSSRGPAVTVAAPGTRLYTTAIPAPPNEDGSEPQNNGYACFSGTSAAAPLVGGAAALLLSLYPDSTSSEIKTWLQEGADDPPSSYGGLADPNDFYGHGRLNIAGAIDAAAVNVDLRVEHPLSPFQTDETRWITARVTRDGQPVSGATVRFSPGPPIWWRPVSVDPRSAVTDANGDANATVTRSRWPALYATVSASVAGNSDSARLSFSRAWTLISARWSAWFN
jgi:hypothetical protein